MPDSVVISGVADLPHFYFAEGAPMRLTVNMGAEFSLTSKFAEFGIRAREGTVRRVFRTDSDESNLSIAGQVVSVNIDPADETVPAFSGGWTLADVQDKGATEFWLDFSDTEGSAVLLRLQGQIDWVEAGSDIVASSSIVAAPEIDVAISSGAVSVSVAVTGGEVGIPTGGTDGQVLAKASNSDYDTEWITASGLGTVTSVAVSGSDGIQVDSGSPITASGTIALGIDAAGLSSHLSLGDAATKNTGTTAGTVAAGDHTHAQLHDAATVSGNGISLSGQQISLDIGTGSTQVAAGNHTHSNFTGDSGAGGAAGFVPAPAAGDAAAGKYLDADGTWTVPAGGGSGTVTSVAVSGTDGLQVDSGSPITSSGTITLGVDAAALSTHLGISAFGSALIDDVDALAARTTLNVDEAGTDNSTNVTLAGTPDYLTLSGQQITLAQIDLATDVTGTLPAANGGTGQTSLGAVDAADLGSGVSADGYVLTSDGLGGSAWEAVAGGGTVTSVAVSATDGLQVDSGSPITGSGTITLGVDAATLRSHINVEDGATGDQTASEILTAIKTVDGTGSGLDADLLDGNEASAFATAGHNHDGTYQPLDSDLTAIAALTPTDSNFIVGNGTAWVAESGATARTSLGLGTAATSNTGDFEAAGAVSTHAAITSGVHGISAFGATLVDDVDAATARTTLGVDAAGTDNSTDVTLAGTPDYITISGQVITRNAIDLATDITGTLPAANGGTGQTSLGAVDAADLGSGAAADGYVLTADGVGGSAWEAVAGGGTVTSVAVSGTDGIDVDSGSPITGAGTITLGINAATLSTHLGLGDAATKNTGTSAGTVAAGDHTHSGVYVPVAAITTESTTTRTLALTDANDWIHCTNASGCTITVPPQADVAWADGTVIYGDQGAAGAVTIAAGSGVTINCADTLVTDGQHSTFAIVRISSNVWILTGRLVA